MYNFVLLPLLIAFLISLIFTFPTIKIANYFKLIDDPAKRKHPASIHKNPIPRAGGIPIFMGILLASLAFLHVEKIFLSMIFAGFIVVIVGIVDDRFDLSPYLRFVLNILCATVVVFSGIDIPFVTNPFGGILYFNQIDLIMGNFLFLPKILAVFWIVWVMNMLNWSKGVDGQMPGIAAVSAVIIGIASLRFSVLEPMNIASSTMSFIVAGSALGFLVFNFHPAKIHPGYSSTILGFTIGILSILSGVKLATAVLVMGVPMIDAVLTILRRILSKKSPFWHDKGHLHHLLLDLGWSQRTIAVFYWTMSIVLGFISLSLSSKGKLFAIILVTICVTGFIFTLRFIMKTRNGPVKPSFLNNLKKREN